MSDHLKVLGVTLDLSITLDTQVTATVRACNFRLQFSRQPRSSLPRDVAQSVACAIIGSRLDYCNSLYYGMSNNNFQRLQRVQNAAARIVCQAPRRQHHSADLLKDLHWLGLCVSESITRLPSSIIKPSNCNNLRILLVYSRHWQTLLLVGSHAAPHRLEQSSLVCTHCWQFH